MAVKELMERQDVTLRMYFEDIADSTPLSREREQELSTLIKAGDHDARQELVEANLRFVIDVAKGYQNRGLDMGELISLGNMGLLIAAERFDGDKGYKFISYAVWWIKQSILQGIADHGRTVRLPLNKLSLLRHLQGCQTARTGARKRAGDTGDRRRTGHAGCRNPRRHAQRSPGSIIGRQF